MKHSINVSLRKSESDLMPIRIRVSFGNDRVDLSLGYSYNSSKWDSAKQRAKNNTSNENRQSAAEVNKAISTAQEIIDNYFNVKELENEQPTKESLRFFFDAQFKKNAQQETSLIEHFDKFVEITKTEKSWAQNTLKKYLHLKKILEENNITEISEETLRMFIDSEIEAGNRNPTILKNFRLLKVFSKWLHSQGLTSYDVETFKIRLKGSERNKKASVYLNWDELMQFWNYDYGSSTRLAMVRDAFCFCSFCGLRFSDASNLKKTDIQSGKINTTTIKTWDDLTIELNKYTREILERYSDIKSEQALHIISNQKTNKYLKEAAKLAGLDRMIKKVYFVGSERMESTKPLYELISSHAARRTFVVQCIRRRIPIPVIMEWTGHSNYDAMKPYIDVVSELKEEEMAKFDKE